MRIAMIDPADFSPPYDEALVGGLRGLGHDAVLFGAVGGPTSGSEFRRPTFYRLLANRPAFPPKLAQIAKGLHHGVDMLRLVADLGRLRPDIIHFQWAPLPLADRMFLASLRRHAPVVLTMHDSQPYNGAIGGLMAFGVDGLARTADAVIVHTGQARHHLIERGVAPDSVHIVPHGLLHAPVASNQPAAIGTRRCLQLLQFGKLRPYKGVDVLLEALALLPPEVRSRLRVHVCGKPYMPTEPLIRFVRQADLEDVVTFRFDFVDDQEIGRLFGAADAALFPYRQIDTSGVAMTAVAHGVPVLASAIGGFVELFEDGREARFVPPADAPALASVLSAWIAEPEALGRLRAGMVRRRGSIPDWSDIATSTLAVYGTARRRWLETGRLAPTVATTTTARRLGQRPNCDGS